MEKSDFLLNYKITWNYDSILSLYYLFLIDSVKLAEEIKDGIVVDELEAEVVLNNLSLSLHYLKEIKKEEKKNLNCFDLLEEIKFEGCELKNGMLIGNEKVAITIAKKWIKTYQSTKDDRYLFRYEVGVYILLLCNEQVLFSK